MLIRATLLAALAISLLPFASTAQAGPACPGCQRNLDGGYRFCPFDGTELPAPHCKQCDREMQHGWRFCPWDGQTLPAPKEGTEAPPAEPAPEEATEEAAPAAEPAVPPARGPDGMRAPLDLIDSLFSGIRRGDTEKLRRLYAWSVFFPDPGPDLDARVDKYLKRLIDRVGPTLLGREPVTRKVKLGRTTASVQIALRDDVSRQDIEVYDFTLEDKGRGWLITSIKP